MRSEAVEAASNQEHVGGENDGQSLPPCDGGKVAWRLLIAMFVFEAFLWGER